MNRIDEIKNTIKHRAVVQKIAKEHDYSFPLHDFVKMINIAIFRFIEDLHEAISFKIKMEIREEEYIKTGDMKYQGF